MALFNKEPEKNPKIQPTILPSSFGDNYPHSCNFDCRFRAGYTSQRDQLTPRPALISIADRKSPARFRSKVLRGSTAKSTAK